VPEVDAPDGSGVVCLDAGGWLCFGRVPDVDIVGDECGELEEDEPLELASGGGTGAGGGAGGATGAGGTWAGAGVGGAPSVVPNVCSQKSVNVFSFKSSPLVHSPPSSLSINNAS
jgi:hypothetical protein